MQDHIDGQDSEFSNLRSIASRAEEGVNWSKRKALNARNAHLTVDLNAEATPKCTRGFVLKMCLRKTQSETWHIGKDEGIILDNCASTGGFVHVTQQQFTWRCRLIAMSRTPGYI